MLLQFVSLVNGYLAAQKREEGQGMVEYALIIALVAILLVASLGQLQGGIAGVFSTIVSAFGVTS